MISAYSFQEMYKDLDIDLDNLGCVMLRLTPPKFITDESFWISVNGADCIYFYSKNPKRNWVKGFVGDDPHCTLLYGILGDRSIWSPYVEKLAYHGLPKHLEIDEFGYFESPISEEPYWCVVAFIKENPFLSSIRGAMEFLPHINTHLVYRPHVTIAYISKTQGEKCRDEIIESLRKNRGTECFHVIGLESN